MEHSPTGPTPLAVASLFSYAGGTKSAVFASPLLKGTYAPVRLRTHQIVVAIVVTAASASSLFNRVLDAQQPDRVVKVQFDTSTTIGRISGDFIGFGYETSAIAQSGFFTDKNTRMVKLYQNLSPHGLIRIGGNVSDHTRFVPSGTPAAKTEREVTVINQANLADLGGFVRATGWHVMWGLNLATGTKEEAVDEAVAVERALGSNLHSFEVGNEVDLMRKYSNDYDAYHAALVRYKTAIRAKLPHAVFSGPDVAGNLEFVERFVAAESSDMKLVTHHYYRGGAHDRKATMAYLLARDDGFDVRLQQLQGVCAAHHLDYRVNEVNSFYGGGKEGVSDAFGSALWCLDLLFDLASHGCGGANIETDINQLGFISFYSPIVHDSAGVCSARPEYYGMLAFAMAGRGELLRTSVGKHDGNLAAYATKDERGTIYVTVINKNLTRDATIECPLPNGCNAAEVYRLHARAVDAKTDVTFAGSAVSADGTWSPAFAEAAPVIAGIARTTASHAGAVVVKFR